MSIVILLLKRLANLTAQVAAQSFPDLTINVVIRLHRFKMQTAKNKYKST